MFPIPMIDIVDASFKTFSFVYIWISFCGTLNLVIRVGIVGKKAL